MFIRSIYLSWIWPLTILLSTVLVGVVFFVITDSILRPIVVMWFLFVCPGMAIIRFFQFNDAVTEWTLAVALSFSLDAAVAGILMYAGHWSPSITLSILMGLSFSCAILQLFILSMKVKDKV